MQRQMPPEERERLRRDVYDSSRENARRQPQYDPRRAPQPLPPDERERLRRDIRDANRDLERRR